ncbi:MAG: hypothetical protein V3V13_03705 [Paracoccaceae bacterium]
MKNALTQFTRDESADITVQWLVITAMVIGFIAGLFGILYYNPPSDGEETGINAATMKSVDWLNSIGTND